MAGYEKPELWLSAGWDAVEQNGWRAPLYWSGRDGEGGGSLPCVARLPLEKLKARP